MAFVTPTGGARMSIIVGQSIIGEFSSNPNAHTGLNFVRKKRISSLAGSRIPP